MRKELLLARRSEVLILSVLFIYFCLFRRNLDYHEVLQNLAEKGISIRVASPKLVMEEVNLSTCAFSLYELTNAATRCTFLLPTTNISVFKTDENIVSYPGLRFLAIFVFIPNSIILRYPAWWLSDSSSIDDISFNVMAFLSLLSILYYL